MALCIRTGDIIYLRNNLFEPALHNVEAVFKNSLAGLIEDGERVETGNGYRDSAPM